MRHQTASFALWLIAAIFAATMAFGSTSAFAHALHDHGGRGGLHQAEYASASRLADVTEARFALNKEVAQQNARFHFKGNAVVRDVALSRRSCDDSNDVCCGYSVGCCSDSCIIAETPKLPVILAAGTVAIPHFLVVGGSGPPSLLEPPNSLA